MANLLIVAGNTALKAAWSTGTTLGKVYRYQGEKMLEYILYLTEKEKPEILTISSVLGVSEQEEIILRKECGHLIILDQRHTKELLKYDFPEYLSTDRVAGLIAARYLFKGKSCSVFDIGTTLTIDFMNSAGKYLGGNVSPGLMTRLKSLNRYTKTLPLVDIPRKIESEGYSIESSIGSGVVLGIMFEIEGYARLRPNNITIFTGGDANYFAGKMKNSIFVVCNLELMGLALITEDYVEKNIK